MKLIILSDNYEKLLEIDGVENPPFGIEVVNAQGGVSVSTALRAVLSKFFYDYQTVPDKRVDIPVPQTICINNPDTAHIEIPQNSNVVKFKPRPSAPKIEIPTDIA